MSQNTEVGYERVYGCKRKRLNTARFFDNHYKGVLNIEYPTRNFE